MEKVYIFKGFYIILYRVKNKIKNMGGKMKTNVPRYEELIDEEADEDVYSGEIRESLLEDDEMSQEEEAFMRGYEEAG